MLSMPQKDAGPLRYAKILPNLVKFSHICAAQKDCRQYVRLLSRATAGMGKKWIRLKVVNEKNSNFFSLYGEVQILFPSILFQLRVGFAGEFLMKF